MEAWVCSGLRTAGGTECSSACMGPFEGGRHYLHYLHHSLTSGQTTGREHSLALQQKICNSNYRYKIIPWVYLLYHFVIVHGGGGGLVPKSCPILATLWTVARQAPLSMGFSWQEYWSRLLFPSPGDLPDPGIKPGSSAFQADSLPTELQGRPIKANTFYKSLKYSLRKLFFDPIELKSI